MKPLTILILLIAVPTMALSATIEVPGNYSTIQGAINASSNGDTVLVYPGTYFGYINFWDKNIHVKSVAGPAVTVIDGQQQNSTVTIQYNSGTDVLLEGFTITNGFGTYLAPFSRGGGGVFIHESSPTIKNNIIRANTPITGLTVGGGIYIKAGDPCIENNVIHDNTGWSWGGALYCVDGSPVIKNNLAYKNTADWGGAFCMRQINVSSSPVLTNNTIWGNSATDVGGGLSCGSDTTIVNNCIIRNNTAGNGGGQIHHHSGTLSVTYSNVKDGWPGTGNISGVAKLYDPGSGDFHLKQDPCQPGKANPCVDGGDPSSPMVEGSTRTDRVQDSGVVDMGYHYPLPLTWHVPGDFLTIQQAIDMASTDDTVLVAPGTYRENISYEGKAVTVKSSDGPDVTVIDGMQNGSCVAFLNNEGPGAVLMGFTITNGSGTDNYNLSLHYYGGGIIILDGSPTIKDNIISDNTSRSGSGIYWRNSGSPTISNNTIRNNSAAIDGALGGGIALIGDWDPEWGEIRKPIVKNNLITNNSASYGGGIICLYYTGSEIENNYIASNSATFSGESYSRGGGISLYGSPSVRVFHNVVCHNSTDGSGGGIAINGGNHLKLRNNLIYSNSANNSTTNTYGGGIYIEKNIGVVFSCCTITNNTADQGGGMYIDTYEANDARIYNTIIWDNNAPTNPEIENTINFEISYCNIKGGWPGYCNIDTDPLFVAPENGNFHLRLDSLCIDAGSNDVWYLSEMDIDGNTRIFDGDGDGSANVDMGADEAIKYHVPADFPTIQSAVDASEPYWTILVSPGTYYEHVMIKEKIITLQSTDGPEVTVIDGGNVGRCVTIRDSDSPDIVLDGFTITNGYRKIGAGLQCFKYTRPTIQNNIITNNTAWFGGGGIDLSHYCEAKLYNNLVVNNTAVEGGGIFCRWGWPEMANNTVANNTATTVGGGIYVRNNGYNFPLAVNMILWGNSAPQDPGIHLDLARGNATIAIEYSDIQGGWSGFGNFAVDPQFVEPLSDDFHLAQDPLQPGVFNFCVDTGDPASPLIEGSTRTDGVQDSGVVDMGYHYR